MLTVGLGERLYIYCIATNSLLVQLKLRIIFAGYEPNDTFERYSNDLNSKQLNRLT